MIKRINKGERMSDAVVYQGSLYYTSVPLNIENDIYLQMQSTLVDIDQMLKTAGTDKSKILDVTIFLTNSRDLEGMNRAWDEWVDKENAPVRCTVQAILMNPEWKVEVKVVAAV